MNAALMADKREAQKQWDGNPCGATSADASPDGSVAFYRSIRRHRYERSEPWLESAMHFAEWRDRDILEIGVGMGCDHFQFAASGARMTGLDLSREHLRHTRRHLDTEGLVTRGVLGDAENMPFPDQSFDLVYTFGVLHHTPNTARALAEIHRVLRPGGQVIASFYHRDSAFFWLNTVVFNGVVRRGLFRSGWRRLMSEIEFRQDGGSACPLVKVYSRRQLRSLFRGYGGVTLRSAHVEASHFAHFGAFLRRVSRARLEADLSWLGWYLVVRGVK